MSWSDLESAEFLERAEHRGRPWSIHRTRGAWRDAGKYRGEFGIQWSAAENVDSRGRLVKARSRAGRPGVTCSLRSGWDCDKHVKQRGS